MIFVLDYLQLFMARREFRSRRADFYFDLSRSLEDKVPLISTLRKLEVRAKQRSRGAMLMYGGMVGALKTGNLSNALNGLVPDNELTLIDALSQAGDAGLVDGLNFLSGIVEKFDAMAASAKKAVAYPLGLLVVFSGLFVGFALGVVPTLSGIFPPEKWPPIGKALYVVSMGVKSFGVFILIGVVVSAVAFVASLSRWHGSMRRHLDRYLPYSFYRDYSGSLLVVSLSSLMQSGVSLRSSLERISRFSTPWMRWHVRSILRRLSNPNATGFGQAFQTGVLNQYLEDRVYDASERRNPVQAFVRIGIGSIDRVIRSIDESAKRVSQIMLVICGLVLGFMISGFLATAMEIQNGIRDSASSQQISK